MGMWELILVFAIVLLFFGASRLPGLGDALGKALRNLKGAAEGAVKDGPAPPRELPGRDPGAGKDGGAPGA
jgi:sec-independent protein translocase protein TatA